MSALLASNPPIDPRFTTQAALNRTVVEQWVAQRDLAIVNEWLEKGYPHKRLVLDAMREAAQTGWFEGAQRMWAARWAPAGTSLNVMWQGLSNAGEETEKGWRGIWSSGSQVSELEQWLEALTWDASSSKEWVKIQKSARVSAVRNALEVLSLDRWQRFWQRGVDLNSASGNELVRCLLVRRYGSRDSRSKVALPEAKRVVLDRMLDDVFALPPEKRAPIPWSFALDLLVDSFDHEMNASERDDARRRLTQLLDQPKPGGELASMKHRMIFACRFGMIGWGVGADDDFMDARLAQLEAWGLDLSVTFSRKDFEYGEVAYEAFGGSIGGPLTIRSNRFNHRSHHRVGPFQFVTPLSPVLHLGEHWFGVDGHDSSFLTQADLENRWEEARARLRVRVESRALKAVADQIGVPGASVKPSRL